MPQLDLTFIHFQYVIFVIQLILIYFCISYFILPLVLRNMYLRNIYIKNLEQFIAKPEAPLFKNVSVSVYLPIYFNISKISLLLFSIMAIIFKNSRYLVDFMSKYAVHILYMFINNIILYLKKNN